MITLPTNLPTDNLYKFVAFAGLVGALASGAVLYAGIHDSYVAAREQLRSADMGWEVLARLDDLRDSSGTAAAAAARQALMDSAFAMTLQLKKDGAYTRVQRHIDLAMASQARGASAARQYVPE